MKTDKVKCDYCGKEITFPAICSLSATIKTRVGVNKPMGYAQFEAKDLDFCDLLCFENWIERKHKAESPCAKVGLWDRTDLA